MFLLGEGVREALLAMGVAAVLALAIVWLSFGGSSAESARDYEECVELAQARASGDELTGMVNGCGARFAGRRKVDGGYTSSGEALVKHVEHCRLETHARFFDLFVEGCLFGVLQ